MSVSGSDCLIRVLCYVHEIVASILDLGAVSIIPFAFIFLLEFGDFHRL